MNQERNEELHFETKVGGVTLLLVIRQHLKISRILNLETMKDRFENI